MEWIVCVRCKKSRCDFVARTCALITPVDPVLHWVSCIYETIPNTSQHFVTHQNIGSNGADWVRSLRKIPMWIHGTNFCINCTSSPRFAPSFLQLRNDPECTKTLCNGRKHEFRVQWSGLDAFVAKKSGLDFVARTFALIAPVQAVLNRVS